MVQLPGDRHWRPLKEVVAEVQLAARDAARRRAERPPAPPPSDPVDDGPPIGIGPGRPSDDLDEGPLIGIGEIADDGPPIGEPEGVQALADEPEVPDSSPTIPTDDGPAIRLKPLEEEATLHFPPESPPAPPVESRGETPPEDSQPLLEVLKEAAESGTEAPVDSPAGEENPIAQVLGHEPAPSGPVSGSPGAGRESTPIPLKPLEGEALLPADLSSPDPVEDPHVGEPSGVQALADDPVASRFDSVRRPARPDDSAPVIPLSPLEGEAPPSPAPWQQDDLPPAPPPPPPEAEDGHGQAGGVIAPPPRPAAAATGSGAGPRAAPREPIDDETETLPPTPVFDGVRSGGLGSTLLGAAAGLGAFFSRLLNPINRLERGEPLREAGPGHQMPTRTTPVLEKLRGTLGSWAGALGRQIARLTRREEPVAPIPPVEPAPLPIEADTWSVEPVATAVEPEASPPEPGGAAAEPEAGPWEPGPAPSRWESPPVEPGPGPEERSEPTEPPVPVAPRPAPREVFVPPPSTSELPSVPLARRHEPRELGDVYEGDDGESPLPLIWHWTKRLVLLAVLVGAGAYVALNWEAWIPAAAELGNKTFTEIDNLARSGERREQQDRILQEIGPQLSQLAPETIRLILSRSPTGVLDAGEVFWIATEATDRGTASLTPAEAEELETLRRDLIEGLSPSERGRVREYETTRASREPFPVENTHALALYARGARALTPEKRERLQVLLGKAIAAGLGPAPEGE